MTRNRPCARAARPAKRPQRPPDIRADHRLSAADRRPHRFAEHRVDAGTAVLHFARNTDDRALAIRDPRSIEQFHQVWHRVANLRSPGIPPAGASFRQVSGPSCGGCGFLAAKSLADFTERASGDHRSRRMGGHCCFHKRRTDRRDCLRLLKDRNPPT